MNYCYDPTPYVPFTFLLLQQVIQEVLHYRWPHGADAVVTFQHREWNGATGDAIPVQEFQNFGGMRFEAVLGLGEDIHKSWLSKKGKRGKQLGQTLTVICKITQNGQLWTSVLLSLMHLNKYACSFPHLVSKSMPEVAWSHDWVLPEDWLHWSSSVPWACSPHQQSHHPQHQTDQRPEEHKWKRWFFCLYILWHKYQDTKEKKGQQNSHAAGLSSSLKPVVYFTYINTLKPACESFVNERVMVKSGKAQKYYCTTMFFGYIFLEYHVNTIVHGMNKIISRTN